MTKPDTRIYAYYAKNGNTVTLTPTAPFKKQTQYTVFLSSGLKDTDGNNYPDVTNFSFTTI